MSLTTDIHTGVTAALELASMLRDAAELLEQAADRATPPGELLCGGACNPGGWSEPDSVVCDRVGCTREAGHPGPHISCLSDTEHAVHVWSGALVVAS